MIVPVPSRGHAQGTPTTALAFAAATSATPRPRESGYYGYPAPRSVDQRLYQVGYENGRAQGENDAPRPALRLRSPRVRRHRLPRIRSRNVPRRIPAGIRFGYSDGSVGSLGTTAHTRRRGPGRCTATFGAGLPLLSCRPRLKSATRMAWRRGATMRTTGTGSIRPVQDGIATAIISVSDWMATSLSSRKDMAFTRGRGRLPGLQTLTVAGVSGPRARLRATPRRGDATNTIRAAVAARQTRSPPRLTSAAGTGRRRGCRQNRCRADRRR